MPCLCFFKLRIVQMINYAYKSLKEKYSEEEFYFVKVEYFSNYTCNVFFTNKDRTFRVVVEKSFYTNNLISFIFEG